MEEALARSLARPPRQAVPRALSSAPFRPSPAKPARSPSVPAFFLQAKGGSRPSDRAQPRTRDQESKKRERESGLHQLKRSLAGLSSLAERPPFFTSQRREEGEPSFLPPSALGRNLCLLLLFLAPPAPATLDFVVHWPRVCCLLPC